MFVGVVQLGATTRTETSDVVESHDETVQQQSTEETGTGQIQTMAELDEQLDVSDKVCNYICAWW